MSVSTVAGSRSRRAGRLIPVGALTAATLLVVARPADSAPDGTPTVAAAARRYSWPRRRAGYESLAQRIAPPPGFARVAAPAGSYADWLRHLPLLPAGTPVRSYRGKQILPAGHRALAAVVDLDVGDRDRQQCADTIMRLRGEYLLWIGQPDRASFRWAGAQRFGYAGWRRGVRPVRQGQTWRYRFMVRAAPSRGAASFRRYLQYMFSWTGTMHQVGEPRVSPAEIRAGDFFVHPGSPGHAVLVLDLARDNAGRLRALIGQGFMPAQDLHLLRDPAGDPARGRDHGSPWFALAPPAPLQTPLWQRPFEWSHLRRFADSGR